MKFASPKGNLYEISLEKCKNLGNVAAPCYQGIIKLAPIKEKQKYSPN